MYTFFFILQRSDEDFLLSNKKCIFTPTKSLLMKKVSFAIVFLMCTVGLYAQSTHTTETQKDKYDHVIGTAETTTNRNGKQTTVYKDRYGHITGRSETRTSTNGVSTTTYKDQYGNITGSGTTKTGQNGSNTTTTTYKDR